MALVFKEEVYSIQGALFEVYKQMGCGFLESVYQECLEKEFTARKIPFVAQPELRLHYKGKELSQTYRPDFICYDSIVVELKALASLTTQHQAQVINYLKATGVSLGLLVNFGSYPKVTVKRLIWTGFVAEEE